MPTARLLWMVLPVLCCLAASARAEFYRWVDERGQVHVSDDLWQVPPAQRTAAEQRARRTSARRSSGWNQINVRSPAYSAATSRPATAPQPGTVHRIPVEQAGTSLTVQALLEGRQRAIFKVDTGAELNMIPRHVVDAMGVVIDERTPTMSVVGISGEAMRVPLVTFREVKLGSAVVKNVEMAVNPRSAYGLLGMTFFNHFKVQTDPVAGLLTLEEIDVAAAEAAGVYGGFGEGYWRKEFRRLYEQLDKLEQERQQVPSTHVSWQDRLDDREEALRKRLDDLHERASRAGVPRAWRE